MLLTADIAVVKHRGFEFLKPPVSGESFAACTQSCAVSIG
jgi:hypothetical protein